MDWSGRRCFNPQHKEDCDMNIDDLTIGQARELANLFSRERPPVPTKDNSFDVGKAYLIRTVKNYFTGRVVEITKSDILLEDAARIPNHGCSIDSLETGLLSYVQPYLRRVAVCRDQIVDFVEWKYLLPRTRSLPA